MSLFTYCIGVWGVAYTKYLMKIELSIQQVIKDRDVMALGKYYRYFLASLAGSSSPT